MSYLLIITFVNTKQIPHTQFDIISLSVDAVLCHDQDTSRTVHSCARSKMPQYNIVNNVQLFSLNGFKAIVCALTGDNRHNCTPTMRPSHYSMSYYDYAC